MKKSTRDELFYAQAVPTPIASDLPYIFVTQFDDASTTAFYKGFLTLQSKKETEVIPIVVSSYGGEVYSLLSMLDIIKSSNKPVATIGMGKAMSCGAILLASGTKGYRYAAPNIDVMIHQVSSVEWGKLADTANGVKRTKKLNGRLFSLLEDYTDSPKGFFQKEMKKIQNVDWFLSAADCKRLKIVDHISVPVLSKK